jgi:hypothetical protein
VLLCDSQPARPSKDHNVQQRVCAKPVRAMHRRARGLSSRHQARNHGIRVALLGVDHLAIVVGGNTPHVVVDGGQDRDGLLCDVNSGKDGGRLGDSRKALLQDLGGQVVQVQVDVVLHRACKKGKSKVELGGGEEMKLLQIGLEKHSVSRMMEIVTDDEDLERMGGVGARELWS